MAFTDATKNRIKSLGNHSPLTALFSVSAEEMSHCSKFNSKCPVPHEKQRLPQVWKYEYSQQDAEGKEKKTLSRIMLRVTSREKEKRTPSHMRRVTYFMQHQDEAHWEVTHTHNFRSRLWKAIRGTKSCNLIHMGNIRHFLFITQSSTSARPTSSAGPPKVVNPRRRKTCFDLPQDALDARGLSASPAILARHQSHRQSAQ